MNGVVVALGVGVLGGVGAVGRYWVHSTVVRSDPSEFPLGTFVVNVAGSFGVGLLFGVGVGHDAHLLLATGLLGAFTTFSTWMFETERMAVDGAVRGAVTNVAVSLLFGYAAVAAGVALGRMF